MISASEMAQIQADVEAVALDKTCQIQRPPTTPNSRGVPDSNYTTVATVTCGMQQPTSTHLANYDYIIGALATWLVRLPVNVDVKPQDRLLVEGQELTVQVVLTPQSYSTLTSVLASEKK